MSESTAFTATCLCKACSFQFSVPPCSLPLRTHLCHCYTCRHTHGSLCSSHASVPAPFPLPKDIPSLATYQTSTNVLRYFCSTCGSNMIDSDMAGEIFYVSTAVLDQCDGVVELVEHIFVEETLDGGLSHWLPKFDGKEMKIWERGAGNGRLKPSETADRTSSDESLKSNAEGKVYAHCHCKGVELLISMPHIDTGSGPVTADPKFPKFFIDDDQKRYIGGICVCDSCRLSSGSHFMPWTFPAVSHITILPQNEPYRPVFATVKEYKSSPSVIRTFCGKCGATVGYHVDSRPNVVDIAVGLLSAESGARAKEWVGWKTGRLAWEKDGIAFEPKFVQALKEGMAVRTPI